LLIVAIVPSLFSWPLAASLLLPARTANPMLG
jgi:hypothetical protein